MTWINTSPILDQYQLEMVKFHCRSDQQFYRRLYDDHFARPLSSAEIQEPQL